MIGSCQLCHGNRNLKIGDDEIKCPYCRPAKGMIITITTDQVTVLDELCSALLMAIEGERHNMAHCLAHILDCLPEYNILAAMLCEIYNIPEKFTGRIKEAFDVKRKFV